jgi:glycosyltransferase involved in cell wall biosynthesis
MTITANTKDRLLVSVVTPAYNQAVFLRETIRSVLDQDYPAIEYRVIDDGSTDDTPSILAEFNGRLQWESHANRGQTATINKGWELARGDVLVWLNSDDTFLPGAVSKAVAYLIQHPDVGIVFGDSMLTDAESKPLGHTGPQRPFDYFRFVLECENPISQPSAFVRRSVVEDIGLLDPHYFYFMDWNYWLRAGIKHRIAYLPEVLSTYRLHAASNTVSQSARVAPELEYMYQKYFASPDLPAQIRAMEKQAMANMYFTSGGYSMKGNDSARAARMGNMAVRTYPRLLCHPRMIHKLLYCWFGSSSIYGGLRARYRRSNEFSTPV